MINSAPQPKVRTAYVDIAKGIGIILVVLGHTYNVPATLYNTIYSFHMPLFFIISGFVYNQDKYNSYGLGQIVYDRAKRYLIPFYLFAGINLVLTLAFNLVFRHIPITLSAIKNYILGTLYCYADISHMPNSSPIWFLMTLFIGGIIFWAIMKFSRKTRPLWAMSLLAISYILYLFVDFRLPLNLAPTGAAVFFMYLGYVVKRHNLLQHRSLILLFIVGFIASYFNKTSVGMNENVYGNLFLFVIAAICSSISVLSICKLLADWSNPINKFLKWLGSNTILIVAFNYFMRDFSTEAYYLVPIIRNYPLHWTVSFFLTLLGCLVLILFWNYIKSRFQSCKPQNLKGIPR